MKRVNYLIETLLVFGLTLNVIDGVNVDFEDPSVELEFREAISQISLPEEPWPDTGALKCRCRNNGDGIKFCGAGNYISVRPKCKEFPEGGGDCGAWSMNCNGPD
jgi:hypothetical protein